MLPKLISELDLQSLESSAQLLLANAELRQRGGARPTEGIERREFWGWVMGEHFGGGAHMADPPDALASAKMSPAWRKLFREPCGVRPLPTEGGRRLSGSPCKPNALLLLFREEDRDAVRECWGS